MTETENTVEKKPKKKKQKGQSSGGCPVYGLGMIGAWIYFFQRAEESEDYALAFLKGLVWPVFLVYEGFNVLGNK
jgi:hypothetical protein